MSELLGVDVGGAAMKLGLVTATGEVIARAAIPFDPSQPFDAVVAAICEAGAALLAGQTAEAVGIATPGHADPATGILLDGANNVPSLRGHSLPAAIGRRLGVPAFVENDGTCATLAEMRFGAGRPFRRFVLITIGTGIDGGVVIDRRVVTGPGGLPPEIGALCLDPDGRHLASFTWPALHRNVRVLLARHGNDAGIIGAAALAAQQMRT